VAGAVFEKKVIGQHLVFLLLDRPRALGPGAQRQGLPGAKRKRGSGLLGRGQREIADRLDAGEAGHARRGEIGRRGRRVARHPDIEQDGSRNGRRRGSSGP
jgi:hypothetical protein